MLYEKSKATWFFKTGEVGPQPCEVRIDGKEIIVAFVATDRYDQTVWKGAEQGQGHYVLRAVEGYGAACLHRLEKGMNLDGYWEEDGDGGRDEGMIHIELAAASVVK